MKRVDKVAESKLTISRGFIKLLQQKKIEDISISEIAKESGITRQTIYRHFKTKEEILLFSIKYRINKVLKVKNKNNDFTMKDLFVYRFNSLKKEPLMKENILKSKEMKGLRKVIEEEVEMSFKDIFPEIEDTYDKRFIYAGLDAIVELWVEGGMKESPEYMAEKAVKLLEIYLWWGN